MKLSFWQQFSSNHSSSFTVVGHFDSTQKADEVERRLRTLLEDIQKQRWPNVNNTLPTWSEIETSQEYNILWDEGFDWVNEKIDDHLIRFENYIFVTTALASTYQCSQPLEQLVGKLADEVYVNRMECGEEMIILVELHCLAPNSVIAGEIAREINLYFQSETIEGLISPWEIYCRKLTFSAHQFIESPPYGREPDAAIVRQAINGLYQYQKTLMEAKITNTVEELAIQSLVPLREQGFKFHTELSAEMLPNIIRQVGYLCNADAFGGRLEISGTAIRFPEIAFFDTHYGLPALIQYLSRKGCSDIRYSLTSVPYASRPEYL